MLEAHGITSMKLNKTKENSPNTLDISRTNTFVRELILWSHSGCSGFRYYSVNENRLQNTQAAVSDPVISVL